MTFFFLLGSVDSEGVVHIKGCWCPDWEAQKNIYSLSWKDSSLEELRSEKSDEVVGCNIVKPGGVAELHQLDFEMACKHQKECIPKFVTIVTGSDRISHFFRLPEESIEDHQVTDANVTKLCESVTWVGKSSLYYCDVVSERLATLKVMEEEARRALLQKKGCLKKVAEKAQVPNAGEVSTAVATLTNIADELGAFGDWLTGQISNFSAFSPAVKLEFENELKKFPMASSELQKANCAECPRDVGAAAKLFASVFGLQSNLKLRAARREAADSSGHTFDGSKWRTKRKKGELHTPPSKIRKLFTPDSKTDSQSFETDPGSTPNTSSEQASSSIVAVDSVIDEDPVDPYVVFVLAVISRF